LVLLELLLKPRPGGVPVVALVVVPVVAPIVALFVAPLFRAAFASPIVDRDDATYAKADHDDGSSQQQ